MKTWLTLGIAVIVLISCKKQQISKLEDELAQHNWKIVSFSEDGSDYTSAYSLYVFSFLEQEVVVANATEPVKGTWHIGKAKDAKTDIVFWNNTHLELQLEFPVIIQNLNGNWEVESRSDSRIVLIDDFAGEDGHTHRLTLEKI